jgi:hypothetical protein
MHIYIYDNYLNEKKYHSLLAKIETRITDLGLNGKIIRLNITNSLYNAIENEIKKGAKTIVAVGNDNLLNQVINSVIRSTAINKTKNIPIGFIPIEKENNKLAKFLGIDFKENACDIISARRIKQLNLGKINNFFFLFNVSMDAKDTIVNIDNNFSIETKNKGLINIINTSFETKDNKLKLIIQNQENNLFKKNKTNQSVFFFKNLTLLNKKNPAIIDNSSEISTPANISLGEESINIIVGKNRDF